jgi:pimeloyl-ACP methyl ester carboxylesterase
MRRVNSPLFCIFWSWVATDRVLSTTLAGVTIPVMLICGAQDLIAPPGLEKVSTPKSKLQHREKH